MTPAGNCELTKQRKEESRLVTPTILVFYSKAEVYANRTLQSTFEKSSHHLVKNDNPTIDSAGKAVKGLLYETDDILIIHLAQLQFFVNQKLLITISTSPPVYA